MFILGLAWLIGIKTGANPDAFDGPLLAYYGQTQKDNLARSIVPETGLRLTRINRKDGAR